MKSETFKENSEHLKAHNLFFHLEGGFSEVNIEILTKCDGREGNSSGKVLVHIRW